MTTPQPYRTTCSSPFDAVQTVFAEAERLGMSVQDVSKRSGYSLDTVRNMRRPQVRRANGSGLNPSLRMITDMAETVGLKIVAVPIREETAYGVRVKPLSWGRDYVRKLWYGNLPSEDTGRGYIVKDNGAWCRANGPWVQDQCGDVDAAKAAAQADYEARILSALEPTP